MIRCLGALVLLAFFGCGARFTGTPGTPRPHVGPAVDASAGAGAIPTASRSTACTRLRADRATLVSALGASGTGHSIVWDGAGYAVTWTVLESVSPVLYGTRFARLTPNGDLLPGSVRRIWPGPESESASQLAVGQGGLGIAIIRGSGSGLTAHDRVWFARLDSRGALVPRSARQLSNEHPPHHGVAIAWSPTERIWAVAWQGTVGLGGAHAPGQPPAVVEVVAAELAEAALAPAVDIPPA